MIRTPFLIGVVLLSALLMGYVVGCVTIPDTGPAVPNYQAEFRIVNLDASLNGGIIRIANGPFDASVTPTFADLPFGAPGVPSAYATFLAGGKKLFVGGVDGDTSVITLNSDHRGTIYIAPRRDIKADSRFVAISERYVFAASPGIRDTTRVRFFNYIASYDTVSIRRSYLSPAGAPVDEAVFTTTLRFQRSSALELVPANANRKYYIVAIRNGVATTAARGDTVFVTGAPYTDLYVMLYDSLSRVQVKAFQAN